MLRACHILGAGILAAGVTLAAVGVCFDPWEQSDGRTDVYPIAPMHIDAEPSFAASERSRECCSCGSSMSIEPAEPVRPGQAFWSAQELAEALPGSAPPALNVLSPRNDWVIRSLTLQARRSSPFGVCQEISPPVKGFDAWQSPMWGETLRMLNEPMPQFTK